MRAREPRRDVGAVQLVGVSKTVPVDRIRAAVAAGVGALGENRVQEAESKVPLLPDAEWHLVGHLQSNKAAKALAHLRRDPVGRLSGACAAP